MEEVKQGLKNQQEETMEGNTMPEWALSMNSGVCDTPEWNSQSIISPVPMAVLSLWLRHRKCGPVSSRQRCLSAHWIWQDFLRALHSNCWTNLQGSENSSPLLHLALLPSPNCQSQSCVSPFTSREDSYEESKTLMLAWGPCWECAYEWSCWRKKCSSVSLDLTRVNKRKQRWGRWGAFLSLTWMSYSYQELREVIVNLKESRITRHACGGLALY